MMMMGYAYQKGLLPLSAEAIEKAIAINGVAVKMNTEAFRLGRLVVVNPERVAAMMTGQDETVPPKALDAMTLDEIIAHRMTYLTAYQNARLAKRYRKLVDQVRDAADKGGRSEEHTSELQSHLNLVCRLLLEKKKAHHDETHRPRPHRW